ncbi:hypothetical protein [Desulfatirhabdium butyrativorans]|uniref:hypothetical protein n=1 Tax=Desulfatirhabdium butyrativorans TaxID=340467 RepID=UPI00040057E7|nr:hypothetical protein [Desulfatirhabdium butyrativorans]
MMHHPPKICITGSDAVLITRLHDGCLAGIKHGFLLLTGYTQNEVVGKSSLDIDIWQDPL